jgi:hypothetical protein
MECNESMPDSAFDCGAPLGCRLGSDHARIPPPTPRDGLGTDHRGFGVVCRRACDAPKPRASCEISEIADLRRAMVSQSLLEPDRHLDGFVFLPLAGARAGAGG